ncbi:MAG TPA: substrate-binding domain-containing protein, partial [Ardenticatenaceae bacterium]|nr:substrate-binding domain-containing protein [Ardenticatenaceae bacterium]
LLLTEQGCNYRSLFERALNAAGVYPSTTLEFGSVEAIKQCVMAGMGITVLPAVAVAAEVAQGRLVALPWADRPLDMVTQMLWHKDKWLSPALGAFLDLTREMLQPLGESLQLST